MSDHPDLVLFFVPALRDLLRFHREQKGAALTESEVNAIRDNAACIRLPRHEAEVMDHARGFRDIDPTHCWEQWQESDHA